MLMAGDVSLPSLMVLALFLKSLDSKLLQAIKNILFFFSGMQLLIYLIFSVYVYVWARVFHHASVEVRYPVFPSAVGPGG